MTKKNSFFRTLLTLGAAVAVSLLLYGCNGDGDGNPPRGTLRLAITDRQSDDFAALVISVKEIRIVPAGREDAADNDPGLPLIASFSPARVIDVMQLHFVQMALGEVLLPAGNYNQIRLILEPNPSGQGQAPLNYLSLKTDPNNRIALTTPSAQQSGLKINGPIIVRPDIINAVMIDFDPNTAIVARGNGAFNFKPTGIRIVQMPDVSIQFGSINGTINSTFKDWSSATVTVRRRGAINDIDPIAAGAVFSSFTSGGWRAPFAAFVPPSSTPSYKAFIAANRFRLYSSPIVSVSQGQPTDLGNITLINLP